MIFFTRVDEDNIKWYYIAPDDYPLEEGDVLITSDTFYEETKQYSLFIDPVEDGAKKPFDH